MRALSTVVRRGADDLNVRAGDARLPCLEEASRAHESRGKPRGEAEPRPTHLPRRRAAARETEREGGGLSPRFSFPRGVACALPAAQEPGNRRLWPCVLQGAKLLSPAEEVKFFKRGRKWSAVIRRGRER